MRAIEIVAVNRDGYTIRTRHYTPEGALAEYQRRVDQGQRGIHKETAYIAPWLPETCTHRPKPGKGAKQPC